MSQWKYIQHNVLLLVNRVLAESQKSVMGWSMNINCHVEYNGFKSKWDGSLHLSWKGRVTIAPAYSWGECFQSKWTCFWDHVSTMIIILRPWGDPGVSFTSHLSKEKYAYLELTGYHMYLVEFIFTVGQE